MSTMLNVNCWNIQINDGEDTLLSKIKLLENEKPYLLRTFETQNDVTNNFDELEQYIFNIAMFHFNRMNITFNPDKHYIQFWCKNNNNYFIKLNTNNNNVLHNSQIIYPLCSTMTNLTTNNSLLFITPFNLIDYKYKLFEEKQQLLLNFCQKNKHIVFDSELYHGYCNINNQNDIYILYINLWDIKVNDEYYDSFTTINNIININISSKNTIAPDKIFISNDIMNKDFYENMLYEKTNKSFLKIIDYLQDIDYHYFDDVINENNNGLIIQLDNIKLNDIKLFNKYKNQYGDVVDDIRFLFYQDTLDASNRFYNYNIYNNIINSDISKWIIYEFELHNNNKQNNTEYMNMLLSIDSIHNISGFFKIFFENSIYNKIIETYKFYNNIFFKIKDIFIYKTSCVNNENFKEHKKDSFLIMYIPLNETNPNDGLFFEDTNTIVNLKEFQMALLSCKKRAFYKKTTEKLNYFIVIILDLIL